MNLRREVCDCYSSLNHHHHHHLLLLLLLLLLLAFTTHMRVLASSFLRFWDHTQWHDTVGRIPLDEWSARRRDLYLTTRTTLTTDKHPCPWQDSNPQSQQAVAADPRLRPLCHWDRLSTKCWDYKIRALYHVWIKVQDQFVPMQTIAEVWFHSFLTSALGADE
jgi:hypothetical protein